MWKIKHLYNKLTNLFKTDSDTLKSIRLDPSGIICNHECPMCWKQLLSKKRRQDIAINNQKHKLKLEEYKKLINSLPKSVKNIDLVGGGEPLLYQHIQDLIQLIKAKNFFATIITNGTYLTQPISQLLIKVNWDYVRISLHAASRQSYKIIHGRDNFSVVIDNIVSFINARKNNIPYLKLLFVIQKENYKEVKKFIKLAETLGVDEVEFDYLAPYSKKELFLSKKELFYLKSSLRKIQTNLKHNINIFLQMIDSGAWSKDLKKKRAYISDKKCHLTHLDLSYTGLTSPCCLLWDSKLNKNLSVKNYSIKEIWKFYKSFRFNLSQGKFYKDCIDNCYYKLDK